MIMKKRWVLKKGFTIVELLIVIVVIGILAAITIVAYNGVTNNARIASVKSDLENSYKQLGVYKTGTSANDSYPTAIDCTASPAANTICIKPSNGTTFYYTGGGTAFCLKATLSNVTYTVSANSNVAVSSGLCNAGYSSTFATFTPGSSMSAITIDSSGNLYAVVNNAIKKITPSGTVTNFAGTGVSGASDGPAASATFNNITGLVFDSSGNLFVAEYGNNVIRKITTVGTVSTFAGSGANGNADGTGTAAQFYHPQGITIDASNNLYVTTFFGNNVRKISTAAVVTTFAGSTSGSSGYLDATGTSALFTFPSGISIDSTGNLIVTEGDTGNRIRKITTGGVVTTIAGSTTGAIGHASACGTAASYQLPYYVFVDKTTNTIYDSDMGYNSIRATDSSGCATILSGSGGAGSTNGSANVSSYTNPAGLVMDSTGNLYVVDGGSSLIRKLQ